MSSCALRSSTSHSEAVSLYMCVYMSHLTHCVCVGQEEEWLCVHRAVKRNTSLVHVHSEAVSLYMCVYMYMYMYMFVYIYTHIHVRTYTHTYIHIHIYARSLLH